MKKQRGLPFGYGMSKGKVIPLKAEARIVCRIYGLYENGGSLSSITSELQKQLIPYSEANPVWNKHMVKRILENPRYIGTDSYPPILNETVYECVRTIYGQKTQAFRSPVQKPQRYVWKVLECADCGSRLLRLGGRSANKTVLECDGCKKRLEYDTDALLTALMEKLNEVTTDNQTAFIPTQELMRMENDISRRIEKPTDGKATRVMILKAAAMRYSLCPDPEPLTSETPDVDNDTDWMRFKNEVETVLMSTDEINIRLKHNRKENQNGSVG
jgi:hypothetical protein